MEDLFDEDKELAKIKEKKIEREVALSHENEKALTDVKLEDIKFKLNTNQSLEGQAEDVAGALSIAGALKNEDTAEELISKKSEELVNKAKAKASDAQKRAIEAETEVQKAERDLYEAVLNTFGIYKHLPRWLMKCMVFILSPLYTIIGLLIGIPCGFVKIMIDNLDGIVCRYEKTANGTKPKIKVIFWILLAVTALGAICLTVLKCLNKI